MQVSGRDGKPLPPWILYDPVSLTLHGEPSVSDAGGWTVQVDDVTAADRQLIRDVFTIQVVEPGVARPKRQNPVLDVSLPEGSGAAGAPNTDGEENEDEDEAQNSEENFVPDDRIVPSLTSPVFGVISRMAQHHENRIFGSFFQDLFPGIRKKSFPTSGCWSI